MSKITSLTVVNQQGTKQFFVGSEYNGLILDRIYDDSIEGDDVFCCIFRGETKDKQPVFETINAPIEVSYSSDT